MGKILVTYLTSNRLMSLTVKDLFTKLKRHTTRKAKKKIAEK